MNVDGQVVLFVDPDGVCAEAADPADDSPTIGWAGGDREVRLVLCSALRTRFELEQMQRRTRINEPFITENGGAVFVPDGCFSHAIPGARVVPGYEVIEVGVPYLEVVARLHQAAVRLQIEVTGFSDLSIEEVAQRCGMSLLEARLAKLREYVEPYWVTSADPQAPLRLKRALLAAGLVCEEARGQQIVGGSARLSSTASLLLTLFCRRPSTPPAFTCGWSAACDARGWPLLSRLSERTWPREVRRLCKVLGDGPTC